MDRSGSCGLIAVFVDDRAYIANVGDSRAIASQRKGRNIFALTKDHKPDEAGEMKRIMESGGLISKYAYWNK